MEDERKKSKFLVIVFWLSAIGCFIFGYYNTHLGLRTFQAFGSGSGSWFLALIPFVMAIGGYLASIQGMKKMLYLYLAGELLFFVFNLTYLYPQYLGRTLVHEETKMLKDSIGVYQGKLDNIAGVADPYSYAKLQKLKEIQTNLLTEIKDREGFGPYATEQLMNFNELAGSSYTPDRNIGKTQDERERAAQKWKINTDIAIKEFLIKLNENDKNSAKLVNAKYEMDDIASAYISQLDNILDDNSDINIMHEAVNINTQIHLLKELTTKLDKVSTDVNSVKKPKTFNLINTGKETIQFPRTQRLGKFEHTIISVRDRMGKLDTWGIIIVCFFFDLLGPFLFYFYLRSDEDENSYDINDGWGDDRPFWKKILNKLIIF